MAADSSGRYVLLPGVWWTTANRNVEAYRGAARTILSSASQTRRVVIRGEPARETRRSGMRADGLVTNQARTRPTAPTVRTSRRSERPVHHGLPRRQP